LIKIERLILMKKIFLFSLIVAISFSCQVISLSKQQHSSDRKETINKPSPQASKPLKPAKYDPNMATEIEDGWYNVNIGGGGYLTGLYLHPLKAEALYVRTDNGGALKWNKQKNKWHPLTEFFTLPEKNNYGIEAIGLDPKNESTLLIATGAFIGQKGYIYRSTDGGKNWKITNFETNMGANEPKRWTGNRLVISPHDSKIVFFGSRKDGLWRSLDGGNNWSKVASVQAPNNQIGILFVLFHPSDPQRMYISSFGDGIYQSNDAGGSWTKLAGSPKEPMKMVMTKNRKLYVTSSSDNKVSVYDETNNSWKNITPSGMGNDVFNGISINPFNEKNIITTTSETQDKGIFISNDGGNSWQKRDRILNKTTKWWADAFFNNNGSSLDFDPKIKNRAYLTDWFGIWKTDNINANKPVWENFSKGHEQLVMFDIFAPLQGPPLISGAADVEGFVHKRLDEFPLKRMGIGAAKDDFLDFMQETYGIASSYDAKNTIVRVGGWRWRNQNAMAISEDNGNTWQTVNGYPKNKIPQQIAVSHGATDNMVVTIASSPPIYTLDKGKSWNDVSGLPNGGEGTWNWDFQLAADGTKPGVFYYYSEGIFYRSEDKGKSFQDIASDLPLSQTAYLQTFPGRKGEIWIALGDEGLYRSMDGGDSFEKIESVEKSILFSMGLPLKGKKTNTLYMYGTPIGSGGEGVYYSSDDGKTWKKISTSRVTVGADPRIMKASNQEPGLIFIATLGRSIYYYRIK
jgi:xyloglucan-specific exo-beta-1,4-glucanase